MQSQIQIMMADKMNSSEKILKVPEVQIKVEKGEPSGDRGESKTDDDKTPSPLRDYITAKIEASRFLRPDSIS